MKTRPCPYCLGRGRITFRHPTRAAILNADCTSCNGTGIDGDPRWLLTFMVFSAVAVVLALIYVVLP